MIAIIGGAGFVGSRLAATLKNSTSEYSLLDIDTSVRVGGAAHYFDVEDTQSLHQLQNMSCIINLAAVHHDDIRPISRYHDVNVQGAINVCKAARDMTSIKLYSPVQSQFMDLHQLIQMNLASPIILMIMAGLSTWRNRYIRSGRRRIQKTELLLL